jgi:hypothetical protein
MVGSCLATASTSAFNGEFSRYHGECPGTGGASTWLNEQTDRFLFYYSSLGAWVVSAVCGSDSGVTAYGAVAGELPFQDPVNPWQCSDNAAGFAGRAISIECTFYDGQPLPCAVGTFDPSGVAPNGDCPNSCPPHLPATIAGATSAADCFTYATNLVLVSAGTNRLTEFNGDSSSYVMMIEEGNLDNPRGVACVNETACVVANEKSHEIRMIIGGEDKGIVATVVSQAPCLVEQGSPLSLACARADSLLSPLAQGSPSGVTYVPNLDLIMVCKLAGNGGVYLFDPRNGDQEEEDAVGAIPTNPALNVGRPQKAVIGEFDNEVLFSTLDRTVIRFCLPATAGGEGCNPARNAIMVSSSNALMGLAVIRETGKFLVAESTDNKVYECELDVTGITTSQCEIFAFSPTSDTWDPNDVLVDDEKKLVYVMDNLYSDVFLFNFDREYLGRLASSRGGLMQPSAMAIRPGVLASLS